MSQPSRAFTPATTFAMAAANYLVNPITIFALGMLGIIWAATWQQIQTERNALLRDSILETANLAIVFEQNVARSISDIDRLTMFMRDSHERSGFKADWDSLVNGRFTIDEQAIQVGIVNSSGIVVASSLGLDPLKPVDVSDREYFRFHFLTPKDELFISKPIIGRLSRQWSVNLSRRLLDEDGKFAGVIVVSLDPAHLSRAYGGVDLGTGSGLVLYGPDDIIRAGTGVYSGLVGQGLREAMLAKQPLPSHNGTAVALDERNGLSRVTGTRKVRGYPLSVMIAGRSIGHDPGLLANRRNYVGGAALLSLVVLFSTLAALLGRRSHERQIMHMARHDSLTKLANRARFREVLAQATAGASAEAPVALHLVDLDRFKVVNDTFGHPVGDKLLKHVADRLRGNLRKTDLVARVGGDEFAIIQTEAPSGEAVCALAERLCRILSEPYDVDGISIEIGASIGIGMMPDEALASADVVQAADIALYCAKSEGRNRHRLFNAGMSAAVAARRALESDLKLALERNELAIHYQPIVDIATSEVVSYEALVRWRHPTRGMVAPSEFIPLAEETGQIVALGAWVLRQACLEMSGRPGRHKLAVNFSPIQFRHPTLVETVRSTLLESGLEASRLEVEITESTLMQTDDATIKQLRELRSFGILFAMDDFGTGFSSLSYLQSYPIDCIKIDRSFVRTLGEGEDERACAIVRAITTLAASLGMRTIAEGVETRRQLELLGDLGCTEAQGYYFSPPKPAEEILPAASGAPLALEAAA